MPYSDPKKQAAWMRDKFRRNVELVRSLKHRPCADCGVQYPFYVMQFDHVPARGKKLFGLAVGDLAARSEKQILLEVAKCDVVCSNCHASRTYQRL
jgi:hypothetical protein